MVSSSFVNNRLLPHPLLAHRTPTGLNSLLQLSQARPLVVAVSKMNPKRQAGRHVPLSLAPSEFGHHAADGGWAHNPIWVVLNVPEQLLVDESDACNHLEDDGCGLGCRQGPEEVERHQEFGTENVSC